MGVEKKLDTPQNLSINGDILSWDPVENATSYDIYVDNKVASTVTVASKANNLTAFLTGIANALRAKKGTTELINPQDFESEITNITITLQKDKTITPTKSEQTIQADAGYDGLESVKVGAIPSEYIDTTSGTATGADILKGKTAYAKGALITGTLTASSITIAVNGTTSSEQQKLYIMK